MENVIPYLKLSIENYKKIHYELKNPDTVLVEYRKPYHNFGQWTKDKIMSEIDIKIQNLTGILKIASGHR
jgi:hypothetical protein